MKNLVRMLAAIGALGANGLLAAFGPAAPPDQAAVLLDRMTPEERVGQLFLVTFEGSLSGSAIADLVQNYHVSGVVLQASRGNFADPPESVQAARSLTEALQRLEFDGSLTESLSVTEGPALKRPEYVPLFIAVGEDGSGRSVADAMPGLSSMASEMAVGATWDLDFARDAGQVLGRELEAVGVNLLLGPALDVVEDPRLAAGSDLGVSAFGGDPFWVGEMGRAYVGGVRAGAGGRLAVVAKHFPGLGGSDRPLQDEVATVRKSLEQLRSIELAPFAAVATGTPGTDSGVVDGLLTAHIRYQGLQGNIRATTRPVSLDPQALSQILALEPLASWRQGGGVTVSDSLGSRALRRFRDPREVTFEGHLVARDALLAGNDLLFLAEFQGSADPDEMTSIRNTLRFFAQRYQEDAVFSQRVDDAVLRILRLKLRLYGGTFDLERVVPDLSKMEGVGEGVPAAFEIAQAAATLLTPAGEITESSLGEPPRLGERVVFFSDVRTPAGCTSCPAYLQLDARALEETVLRLYGPRAAGQVESWHLASFTLADLAAYLGEPVPRTLAPEILSRDEMEQALQAADWLVFVVLNSSEDAFGANALKLFLSRRPDLARAKRVVVFALDVPYDLDSTEISQLDVFYALFDQSDPFIDVAARLLFQELTAPGASPVSISGIGYDLIEAMQPDPNQIIGLTTGSQNGDPDGATPPVEGFVVGDSISVSTSVVRDANGHPVPDGTPVDFFLVHEDSSSVSLQATTVDGVAETELILDRLGRLRIAAESGPARTSEILEMNVQEGVPAFITVIAPTPAPSVTLEPTGTVTGETPTPEAPTGGNGQPGDQAPEAGWWALLLAVLGSGLIVGATLLVEGRGGRSREEQIRFALGGCVGGLAVYNYLAIGLPGSGWLLEWLGPLAGFAAGAAGSAGGWWIARTIQARSSAVTPP